MTLSVSLFEELTNLEANLFPTAAIGVTQRRLEELIELQYTGLQIRRSENQTIDGICISVFIDRKIEEWLSNSQTSNTIYDLPDDLVCGLFAKSDAVWLDLVAGLSSTGKTWAVRQAVRLIKSSNSPSRIYSYPISDEGLILAKKLGLTEVSSSGLYRKAIYEEN